MTTHRDRNELQLMTIKQIKDELLNAGVSVRGLRLKQEYIQRHLDSQKTLLPSDIPQSSINESTPIHDHKSLLQQENYRFPHIMTAPPLSRLPIISAITPEEKREYQLPHIMNAPPLANPIVITSSISAVKPDIRSGTPEITTIEPSITEEITVKQDNSCIYEDIGYRAYMEDRYVYYSRMVNNIPIKVYGIFDGHAGRRTAELLKEELGPFLVDRLENIDLTDNDSVTESIRQIFVDYDRYLYETQELGKAYHWDQSGSTAVLAIIIEEPVNIIHLAHIGDSRAVVFTPEGNIVAETHDHKPDDPAERQRIESTGHHVIQSYGGIWRVDGSLAVARAFGDFSYKLDRQNEEYLGGDAAVTPEPDITSVYLIRPLYIILASDGLWDYYTSYDAVQSILENENLERQCEHLAKTAVLHSRSKDNTTVIIIQLD